MLKYVLLLAMSPLIVGCKSPLERQLDQQKEQLMLIYVQKYRLDCELKAFSQFPDHIVTKDSYPSPMGFMDRFQNIARSSTLKANDANKEPWQLAFNQCIQTSLRDDEEYRQGILKIDRSKKSPG